MASSSSMLLLNKKYKYLNESILFYTKFLKKTSQETLLKMQSRVEKKETKELRIPFYVFIQQNDEVYEYGKLKYTVQKGDILEVLRSKTCRSGHGECWKVKNVKTGMIGYVKADSMKELHSIRKKSKTK